jgi:hypothetical protein
VPRSESEGDGDSKPRGERKAVHDPQTTHSREGSDVRLFLAVWIASMLVIFSVVRSKLPGYVFPVYPACALMVAQLWSSGECANLRRSALAAAVAACAAAAVMLVIPPYLQEPIPGVTAALIPMAAALVLGCATAYVLLLLRRPTAAFGALCAGMAVFMLVVVRAGLPIAARPNAIPAMRMGREIARRAMGREIARHPEPAFALNLSPPQPQLGFYAGRAVRQVDLEEDIHFRGSPRCQIVMQRDRSVPLFGFGVITARIGPYFLVRYSR